jgi:hypothetical protein
VSFCQGHLSQVPYLREGHLPLELNWDRTPAATWQDAGCPEPGTAAPPAASGVLFSTRSQVRYGIRGIPEADGGLAAAGDMSASVPHHVFM